MKWQMTCLGLVVVSCMAIVSARSTSQETSLGVDPEVYMNATELITSKGFPCETHHVTTKDGFILTMQRIPLGRVKADKVQEGIPVVLLMHGLDGSAYNWLDNLANESLAYILADAGADVWIGNSRGNLFSRNHTTYTPDQNQFWDFTWDEMAANDLPAMFDYISRTTSQARLHYVGHSQGTMIGFAGFANNATLASMVHTFYALAPVARVGNIQSALKYLAPYGKSLTEFVEIFGHGEFAQYNPKVKEFIARFVCPHVAEPLCEVDILLNGGFNRADFNQSRIPVYIAHGPGGTSVKNVLHYGQGVNSKLFQMFDYGSDIANQAHYNQSTPPLYNPKEMTVPVISYRGDKDPLSDTEDAAWLLSQLPNLLAAHTIPGWEHLDPILAMNAPDKIYKDLVNHVMGK